MTLHKREYEITNAQVAGTKTGAEILQIGAKVTEHLGIRHGEHGEEIPRTKTQTIGIAIPVSQLPSTNKKAYVMREIKVAYKAMKETETEANVFVGYKVTETVT